MTIKDLKTVISHIPDDAIIVVCNPALKTAEISGYQSIVNFTGSPFDGKNVLFLDVKSFK